ncbi:hypothetical protein ABK040_009035 [Willaertia magna]
MSTIINSQKIIQAEQTIRKIIHQPTPLVPSLIYNNLFYKQDFLQYTGSFKLRGASYKLLSLLSSQLTNNNHSINSNSINNNSINNNELNNNNNKKLTVVTASTGNHGYAIAYAAKQLNINAIIFVPENADISKIENIKRLLNHSTNNNLIKNGNNLNDNSKIIIFGNDCLDCELEAKRFAKENNLNYISPYNDYDIIIGQGTIAVEMNNQLNYFLNHSLQYNLQNTLKKDNNNKIKKDGKNLNFYISVGGGGLISGIAIYLKEIYKNCKIYGCQPQNSAVMYYSLLQNKILTNDEVKEEEETISDGTAGGIEENTITFKYCKDLIDEFILVSELEIKESLKFLVEKEKVLVEGAAAVALACYRKKMLLKQQQQQQEWMEGKKDGDDEGSDKDDEEYHIVVLCGRNISLDKLKDILMM